MEEPLARLTRLSELSLSPEAARKLLRTAGDAVQYVIAHWLDRIHDGKGGVFHAYLFRNQPDADYRDLYQLTMGWIVGFANTGRKQLYVVCAPEKAMRLANHRQDGHVSSFQSRTLGKTFSGAILFQVVIPEFGEEPIWMVLSFSGLPETADEAAMVLTAYRMREHGWQINVDSLRAILAISHNDVFKMDMSA